MTINTKDDYLAYISSLSQAKPSAEPLLLQREDTRAELSTTYGYQSFTFEDAGVLHLLNTKLLDQAAASPSSTPLTKPLRIASYNVLFNGFMGFNRFDLHPDFSFPLINFASRRSALVQKIKSFDADLIMLQELSQDLFVAIIAGMPDYVGAYFENQPHQGVGLGALVRVAQFDAQRISVNSFKVTPSQSKRTGKVGIIAHLSRNGKPLNFAGLHLTYFTMEALKNAENIASLSHDLRAIYSTLPAANATYIMGDYNLEPATIDTLMKELDPGFTRSPSKAQTYTCFDDRFDPPYPQSTSVQDIPVEIDHLYYKGEVASIPLRDEKYTRFAERRWGPPQVVLDAENPSDHLPIVFTIGH
jgi:endonuclease/exonuclease/phosphatase family metal-dependent hydrolase